MGRFTQEGRPLRVRIQGLEADELLLRAAHGKESISRLYHFDLQLLSENPAIDFHNVIGREATVELRLADDSLRYFSGILSGFSQGGSTMVQVGGNPVTFAYYEASLVPWIWRLTLRANCRIFQNLSVPEIVTQILDEHDIGRHRMRLQRSYEKREYCVQYRETDFNFISRLLEEEGIFYFFEHTADTHTMLLADHHVAFRPCASHSAASFAPQAGKEAADGVVVDWQMTRQERPVEFTHRDFKFQQPDLNLTARAGQHQALAEVYDFPGEFRSLARGQQLADVRMEQEALPGVIISGSGACAGFTPGYRFELDRHYRADFNAPYALTSVTHSADAGSGFLTGTGSDFAYLNTFDCIPFGEPYRPQRLTPSPVIHGTQTAIVVGPPGEEIYVDEYGRVKVQFHWDRLGTADENSSCFLRVSQYWAGKGWGAVHTPRIGQEVIVDFLEGDPDQPIIVGRVYNGNSRPPYELPRFQTISTVKSNSTTGGSGFNEVRFEDKKGREQVFIHSQKRMDVRVRQSLYETNHANRHVIVGWKDDDSGSHGGNYTITVGGDRDIHINGGLYERVEKKLNQSVGADVVYDFGANEGEFVKAKRELNAQKVTIEALQEITLKVGSSFVKIDLTGITIQGPMVKINSGGSATGTGSADIEDPVDADVADTGEPGWIDRPRPPGSGGGGRRRRTLNGYHAPAVTRNADGSYQMGNIRVNQGTRNPDFQRDVLNDLAMISTTRTGRATLDSINSSGRTVTIVERTADRNNAGTNPDPRTIDGWRDATASGSQLQGRRGPLTDPAGNPITGTGRGTNSTVDYDPTAYPVPHSVDPHSQHNEPSDAVLHHELSHSDHMAHGTVDMTPTGDNFDNVEERNTIGNPNGPDNDYRDERGIERRRDHHDY